MTHPSPNASDIAEAEAAYAAFDGRFGMIHDRADYIERLAEAAMHKRLDVEFKAQFKTQRRHAA